MKKYLGILPGVFSMALIIPGLELSAQTSGQTAAPSASVTSAVAGIVDKVAPPVDHGDRPDFDGIPNPNDVTVTRENFKRIVNILLEAGLNRKQIKRWIHASLNAANNPDIPAPGDIALTRENFKRVINMLKNAGLNRREIKRWINASLNAHFDRPDVRRHRPDRKRVTDKVDIRPDKVTDRVHRPTSLRSDRPKRIIAPTKPVRVAKPLRPR